MNIIFFTKKDKPFVQKAIHFLKLQHHTCIVFEGHRADPFPVISKDVHPDILISYLSPWVIPKFVLDNTKKWNINFHPGPPEYPGIGCTNFAIYNKEKEFGVTAHLMNPKVDEGNILAVKRFNIALDETVYSLTHKSYFCLYSVFTELMNFILSSGELPKCNEVWARKPYQRKELESLCRIDFKMTEEEVNSRIKATTYPGMPGAYIEIFNKKFEYTSNKKIEGN